MPENTYMMGEENNADLARLLVQDNLINTSIGLLPDASMLEGMMDVLDIGCGPGGWILDLCRAHPCVQGTGIDISQRVIAYAQEQAQVQGLLNAHFDVVDATLQPLPFLSSSFDLINERLAVSFLHTSHWIPFLQECKRLLRSGGALHLTETEYSSKSNGEAFEQFTALFRMALKRAGHSLAPASFTIGNVTPLMNLLPTLGFEDVACSSRSFGSFLGPDIHQVICENMRLGYLLIQPFIVKQGVATQEEIEHLYQHVCQEMKLETFQMECDLHTITAQLP